MFQKELGKRASCIKTLKRSVRDLTRGSSSVDSQWLQRQVEELSTRWDLVCKLSLSKQARLEAALRQVSPGGTAGAPRDGECRGEAGWGREMGVAVI